tara:strand:+ start:219 stop:356 length:138 start_codon:yes stop_codon:yes gene_type:complete
MAKHIECGRLFTGLDAQALDNQTIVVEDSMITYVGPSGDAPAAAE